MRARYPDVEDVVVRDGVRIGYEVYGSGAPTILLPTSNPIVHARQWKAQVPFLARHFRVVVVDGRGNGRSDRPVGPAAYTVEEDVADLVAVLDATRTDRAVVVGLSLGARRALALAAAHPARVAGVVAIGPASIDHDWFDLDDVRADYTAFVRFFHSFVLVDPHSTRIFEDCVGQSLETTPDVLVDYFIAQAGRTPEQARDLCSAVRCPVLVVHGTDDTTVPYAIGVAVAEWTGGALVTMPGSGHVPPGRDPVRTNLLIRDFARSVTGHRPEPSSWTPARNRPRRVLCLSSPIGLGHARRDLAIADELRKRRPDVEIDWLAQHPVTAVLEAAGERVHPASRWLANESAHVEAEAGEHDLHAFQAVREMDEILLANFHVLDDLTAAEHYDLVVGDEAWDLDFFLHENPELKRTAYAWLTDFVGNLPMPEGGPEEVRLTTDHNAQMIEQIERYPRLRDAALFVGDPDDIVPDTFGPGLPSIRDWTRAHYDFLGYVTGFTPVEPRDRPGIRDALGWRPGEPVCLVTAGGSGVGLPLLRRVVAAPRAAQRRRDATAAVPLRTRPRSPGRRARPAASPARHGCRAGRADPRA